MQSIETWTFGDERELGHFLSYSMFQDEAVILRVNQFYILPYSTCEP
jgi:hypothetical protein